MTAMQSTALDHPGTDHVVARAAQVLAVPRREPADSFVLHAQLELLARVGLLDRMHADRRDEALSRIDALAADFAAAGDPVDEPHPVSFDSTAAAASVLSAALDAGDLDEVDRVAVWLAGHATHHELAALLGSAVVARLGAAGHAPIGLHLLPAVARGALPATLLRQPLREIARRPEWRLTWFERHTSPTGTVGLLEALASVPHLGRPGSDFIFPLMSQVERSGVAEQVLAPVLADRFDVRGAGRTLGRIAAWSMLRDDPTQAPYGWTHCLTMPQAVMGLAGAGVPARTALAVAATYVVGFRAASGLVPLDPALGHEGLPVRSPGELATFAALHHDAHLVKYTLACLIAADHDPAGRDLYLAAAGHLADWWRDRG
jgi:hypothetical protein